MALVPPTRTQGGYPIGLTGATAATRYVGATATGAPVAGTFRVGDFVIDQTGKVWVCTVAGSPGTWGEIGGGGAPGAWASYVPTITAVTTPPTMGVGAIELGSYLDYGTLAVAQVQIVFGSSGVNAGNGVYSIDTPVAGVAADPDYGVIGSGTLYDASTNTRYVCACCWFGASRTEFVMMSHSTTNEVSNAVPITWAASDALRLLLTYETA